ncbi:ABC transporter ATP-binding protein [Salsipaludibacter albus]|uniref:ABC transporter ATP-binding protein n=1 Tax=Salsipaludibacter albus TaxID=2849650 RepID=UPI001EE3CFBC|nr:ABC transporter ATP-binding protein [Salsipaludibacter albus]MBY5160953.1 ABC transporter ATP-binding protein [Salsipaludibacter albus]
MSQTEIAQPDPETAGYAARAYDLTKVYGTGDSAVTAVDDVTIGLERGVFTAIMGPSGSGKSTLMHCIAGLDTPTTGRVFIGDVEITGLADKALTRLRRDRLGFVFQAFNLVPVLTARENLVLPARLAGTEPDQAWVDELVDVLGMGDRLDHRPTELSGGQQQRVAVGRALMTRPDLVLADEPTGNLDSASSESIMGFLSDAVSRLGQSVAMVTHDPWAASYASRVVFLRDGAVVGELADPTTETVLDRMKQLGAG